MSGLGRAMVAIGAAVVAAIVLPRETGRPPSVDELYAWCRANLSPQKTPERWFFVNQYPLTSTGKIQKNVLADWVRENRITPESWVRPSSRGFSGQAVS
jgi:fatty-acyl-CoA synthase